MTARATPTANDPPSPGANGAVGTVATPAADGEARGPQGAEPHVISPRLGASPRKKSPRRSSRREPNGRRRQVQSFQCVRCFQYAQPPLEQRLDTETPSFGPEDWRGITFNGPVPGRFVANQTVTMSGHVTASDRTDFSQVSLAFWRVNETTPVEFPASISRSGDFTVPVRFTDAQRGVYELAVYLFWPGAG